MSRRIYIAQEIAPEYSGTYTEDDLMESLHDEIFINGGGYFHSIMPENISCGLLRNCYYDLIDAEESDGEMTKVIYDYLPKEGGTAYTGEELHNIITAVKTYNETCHSAFVQSAFTVILSCIKGIKYDCVEIHGCTQGEFATVYYPAAEKKSYSLYRRFIF